jgi:hypothetical protein
VTGNGGETGRSVAGAPTRAAAPHRNGYSHMSGGTWRPVRQPDPCTVSRPLRQTAFAAAGLELSYLSTNADIRYDQNGGPFVPDLSVIGVLMFNSPAQTRQLLDRFVVRPPHSLGSLGDVEPSPPRPPWVPLDDRKPG